MVIEQRVVADAKLSDTEIKQLKEAAAVLVDMAGVLSESDCDYYLGGLDTAFRKADLLALHDKLIMLTEIKFAKQEVQIPWS